MKRWLDVIFPALLLLGALALRLDEGPVIEQVRHLVFDAYQNLRPRPFTAQPVRIVDIDEDSLKRLGQWPWPRSHMARLVDRLHGLGVAVIALDVLFAEPDRMAPANLLALWRDRPEMAGLSERIAQLPDPDGEFAASLARANAVTTFVLSDRSNETVPALKSGFASAGDDPTMFAARFAGAIVSLPPLEQAAAGNGFVNTAPDRDGIIRRVPLLMALNGQLYPSLAAEALRLAQGAPSYTVKASGASGEWSFGASTGITRVRIGAAIVPTDAGGNILLYDSGPRAERYISAWRVLEPDFDPAALAGQIVLIGTSVEGLKDVRSTPLDPVMPGVEIHAQVLEQILSGDFLTRPDWADGAEILFLAVFGTTLILALRKAGALWAALIAAAALAAAVAGSWFAFARAAFLFDPLFPALTVVLIYTLGTLFSYLRTEGERRYVRSAFGRYLSPVLVEELTRDPGRLKLGGEMRELTLMFCDIRDFTHIAERLTPEELTRLINGFLTPMTTIIQNEGGTIDKYIGDCIMAFWNAPLAVPEHARRAVRAALAMRTELDRLNRVWAEAAHKAGREPLPVRVGIGLNTGVACVGNMGSDQRFDYSVLGDAVNLASRLEGLSRAYGVDIVLGEDTAAEVADMALLEMDLVRVKGRAAPLSVFAVLGDAAVRAAPWFAELAGLHGDLIAAYRGQDWRKASAALAAARRHEGGPAGVYELYEQRIAAYVASPPPPDWDGVFVARTKTG